MQLCTHILGSAEDYEVYSSQRRQLSVKMFENMQGAN